MSELLLLKLKRFKKRLMIKSTFKYSKRSLAVCYLLASMCVQPANASSQGSLEATAIEPTDYVDMVDPYIMSARGRWFFFGTGKRPFGMVNVFPDTSNEGQGGGGYNYRFNDVLGFCHLHGWMTVGLDMMPTTGERL